MYVLDGEAFMIEGLTVDEPEISHVKIQKTSLFKYRPQTRSTSQQDPLILDLKFDICKAWNTNMYTTKDSLFDNKAIANIDLKDNLFLQILFKSNFWD